MSVLKGKIDFMLLVSVTNANPNGDPLNGNRPRENFDGYGEISDVCIKRKIRNRLQDMGQKIFVQSDGREDDGYKSLRERAESCEELKATMKSKKQIKMHLLRLLVKNGWMLEALDRYLHLKEVRFLLVFEDQYLFIRQ